MYCNIVKATTTTKRVTERHRMGFKDSWHPTWQRRETETYGCYWYEHTHTRTCTHTVLCVCVNRGWGSPAQGRKEEIRARRRRRGCREMRMENRFMKWSIPNRTICLLWETPFINHHTAAENRAFGRFLVCVCWCLCTRGGVGVCWRKRGWAGESFIPVTGLGENYSGMVVLQVMHTHARQCQREHVEPVCAAVFVGYCPPTGYLYREHDIKRDR